MKHILLVIENESNTLPMLKKAMTFLPEVITFLVFGEANQKSIFDSQREEVDLIVNKLCKTSIIIQATNSMAQKVEKLSDTLNHNSIDMTIVHRPHKGSTGLDFSLIKAALRSATHSTVFLCGDNLWSHSIKLMGTLDIFDHSPAQEALNTRVINVLEELSVKFKAGVKVLSVIPIARIKEELDITYEEEVLSKEEKSARAKLESIVKDAKVFSDVSVYIAAGSPAFKIATVARKSKVSLVVIGNVGRTGVKGLFIGNTAEKILSSLAVDALIVRH